MQIWVLISVFHWEWLLALNLLVWYDILNLYFLYPYGKPHTGEGKKKGRKKGKTEEKGEENSSFGTQNNLLCLIRLLLSVINNSCLTDFLL